MVALLAVLVVFAACKGDTPTAPPPGGGGGNIPPTGVTLALTASNSEPLVDSSVTITATVTQNGAPVPNGTAVEFVASAGLIDGAAAPTIKTTTNGVATVVLTSSSAGKITVQATVNNVSKTVDVTFRATPVEEQPPDLTPVISTVTPAIGRPSGGEIVRITGKNFRSPVKVLFDTGGLSPVEAFVSSVSETVIEVVTPAVNLGAGQQLVADLIVITEAGTAKESRLEVSEAFTFRNEQLTPVVYAVSPNSGPENGGTQIKIFGEGFQAPVQLLFGDSSSNSWNEVQVISVKYGEIVAITPPYATVTAGPSGFIDIKIINIFSNTSVEGSNHFQYLSAMIITAAGPNEGPATGGTRVTIDGSGFVGPIAVTIGGIPAQPISVSGTKIVAVTDGVDLTSCADVSGPIVVTNITTGTSASGPSFTYRVPKPIISAISPSSQTPGGSVSITVQNVIQGVVRIKLGDRELFPTSAVYSDDGSAVFTVTVPANFEFTTEACTESGVTGEREVPALVDVVYTNVENGCTNTLNDGLEIVPPDTSCQLPPPPDAAISPETPPCISMGSVASAGTTTGTLNFTVSNFGGQPLVISSAAVTASSNATVTVSPPSATVAPSGSQQFTVTADPTAAGAFSGTITLTTNDPDEGSITYCFDGTGT